MFNPFRKEISNPEQQETIEMRCQCGNLNCNLTFEVEKSIPGELVDNGETAISADCQQNVEWLSKNEFVEDRGIYKVYRMKTNPIKDFLMHH